MQQDSFSAFSTNIQSDGNLTWRLSPDDPDQINGALNYRLYRNVTSGGSAYQCGLATGTTTDCGWQMMNNISPGNYVPIPGRPGWVKFPTSFGVATSGAGSMNCNSAQPYLLCRWNVTALRVSGTVEESSASCVLTVDIGRAGTHDQCGDNLTEPPAGVAAQVQSVSSRTAGGLITLNWPLSPDDNNTNTGNLTYKIRAFGANDRGERYLAVNDTDSVNASDGGGYRRYNVETGGEGRYSLAFQVAAWDPVTLIRSNWSCETTISVDLPGLTGACNGVSPFGALGSVAPETPLFPLVNVNGTAEAVFGSGSLALAPWIFGAILIALGAASGVYFFGASGLVIGSAVGLGGSAILGLVPLWLIIAAFALMLLALAILRTPEASA